MLTKSKVVKFLELVPAVAMGIAYLKYDLYVATLVLMIAMTVFVVSCKLLAEPLSKFQFWTWVAVLIFGGMTLYSQDMQFIKWKTTVFHSILASALALSHVVGEKTILEALLESKLTAPRLMLRRLNIAAIFYCLTIGGLNLLVASFYGDSEWVGFKIFGILAVNMVFIGGSIFYLRDYIKDLGQEPK